MLPPCRWTTACVASRSCPSIPRGASGSLPAPAPAYLSITRTVTVLWLPGTAAAPSASVESSTSAFAIPDVGAAVARLSSFGSWLRIECCRSWRGGAGGIPSSSTIAAWIWA